MPGSPTIASLFAQRVVIGVGDLAASNNCSVTLSTYALGSCVGVVAYDPMAKAGGILHLMLPDSNISPDKAAVQPAMFADTGFPLFLRQLASVKAEQRRLRLVLAGGAAVLQGTDPFKIGTRNIAVVKTLVQQNNLMVVAADVGGVVNRTVHLNIATGEVTLKMPSSTDTIRLG